jgi:tetratricopeptide (TPR) repeat protein
MMREVLAAGAAPADLAAAVAFDPKLLIEVAEFVASQGRSADAFAVLDQADELGAPRADSLLARARLQIDRADYAGARQTLAAAHAKAGPDPRITLVEARLLLATGSDGADQALRILDAAAAQYPFDLAIQRTRVELVMRFSKWQAADRAVEGLKQALYQANGAAGEAHVAAARIKSRMSRWTAALGEYRIALADNPNDVALWIEFGHAAEQAGRDTIAREAFGEAARLSPSNSEIGASLRRLDERQSHLHAPFPSLNVNVEGVVP